MNTATAAGVPTNRRKLKSVGAVVAGFVVVLRHRRRWTL